MTRAPSRTRLPSVTNGQIDGSGPMVTSSPSVTSRETPRGRRGAVKKRSMTWMNAKRGSAITSWGAARPSTTVATTKAPAREARAASAKRSLSM